MNNGFMLPWMALMSAMGHTTGSRPPAATIQKRRKKKAKRHAAPPQPMPFCEAPRPAETAAVVVPNMEAEQKEIQVEKAFRLCSSLSLPFFGSVHFDMR